MCDLWSGVWWGVMLCGVVWSGVYYGGVWCVWSGVWCGVICGVVCGVVPQFGTHVL